MTVTIQLYARYVESRLQEAHDPPIVEVPSKNPERLRERLRRYARRYRKEWKFNCTDKSVIVSHKK